MISTVFILIVAWLIVLSVMVILLMLEQSPKTEELWDLTPGYTSVRTFPRNPGNKAEFIASTRINEIIKGKKDVTLDDILR